jgi:hypothetical protein
LVGSEGLKDGIGEAAFEYASLPVRCCGRFDAARSGLGLLGPLQLSPGGASAGLFARDLHVDRVRAGRRERWLGPVHRVASHLTISRTLGVPVYFCDSHSPWQRGSNENMNGLLRDYFPKGTNLHSYPVDHLLAVETELNNRPRIVLNDRCPAELYTALLASQNRPVLRR